LTREGRTKIEQLFPRFNAEEATVAGALSAAEQDELARLLRTVARSV
jgi:ABC-type branched-subunit amino acid transport system ATPase component